MCVSDFYEHPFSCGLQTKLDLIIALIFIIYLFWSTIFWDGIYWKYCCFSFFMFCVCIVVAGQLCCVWCEIGVNFQPISPSIVLLSEFDWYWCSGCVKFDNDGSSILLPAPFWFELAFTNVFFGTMNHSFISFEYQFVRTLHGMFTLVFFVFFLFQI